MKPCMGRILPESEDACSFCARPLRNEDVIIDTDDVAKAPITVLMCVDCLREAIRVWAVDRRQERESA